MRSCLRTGAPQQGISLLWPRQTFPHAQLQHSGFPIKRGLPTPSQTGSTLLLPWDTSPSLQVLSQAREGQASLCCCLQGLMELNTVWGWGAIKYRANVS